MKIITTNLAMRFYKNDGWNEDTLLQCVQSFSHPEGPFKYFKEDAIPYWIPNVGTKLDLDMLLEKASTIQRTFNDFPEESDKQHLQRFNW